MAKKLVEIKALSESALQEITSSTKTWKSYLISAAHLYKYSFTESVLIHAQKPNAKAVAGIDIWNGRFNRYVNRGTKGIALIDDSREKHRVRYVFAIEDTNGGKLPKLWQLERKHHDNVIVALETEFGAIESSNHFETDLIKATKNHIEEGMSDYISELYQTSIEEYGKYDESIEVAFKNTLLDSVTLMVFERLGLDLEMLERRYFLFSLSEFESPRLTTVLGVTVQSISNDILRVIEHTVKQQEREEAVKFINMKIEGSAQNEPNNKNELYEKGQPAISEVGDEQGQRKTVREIRTDEENLHEKPTSSIIQPSPTKRPTDDTITQNRRGSMGDVGTGGEESSDKTPVFRNRGRHGTDSTPKHDSSHGRRSRHKQLDTQQLNFFEGVEEQPSTSSFFDQDSKKDIEPTFSLDLEKDLEVRHEKELSGDTPTILEPIDYQIDEDTFALPTGIKDKVACNIEVIRTLRKIESEQRKATKEEQELLAKYTGWGGIPDVFDESKQAWDSARDVLKNELTEEEYEEARASTLTAFYTPPTVIRSIHQALVNFGFEGGNILEPSMGTGNFLGMLPEALKNSNLYGIELDSITGKIAQQLYQTAHIEIKGFEKTDYPDNFFDVAVGNVPFGEFRVNDPKYNHLNYLIHDYFFSKALDKVRPGGIVAFVTSKGTLDKTNDKVRKYLASRAELVGAIRLPNDTFKQDAGTDVTSDIIFLQKRVQILEQEEEWTKIGTTTDGISINQYFASNPEMMLGRMVTKSGRFGEESTLEPLEDKTLSELLEKAISNLSANIKEYDLADDSIVDIDSLPADPSVKNYCYTLVGDSIYFRENSIMNKCDLEGTPYQRVKGLIGIREAVREVIRCQLEDGSDTEIRAAQADLNLKYDNFVKKYDRINSRGNNRAFRSDTDYPLLSSLEVLDDENKFLRKADMFTKRTIKAHAPITSTDTVFEALAVSLNEKGKVDILFMANLTGVSTEEVVDELVEAGSIYANPLKYFQSPDDCYEPAGEYLSGNVREKLRVAESFAADNPLFEVNVAALRSVQPEELQVSEINVRLGATWVPSSDVEQFVYELLDTSNYTRNRIKVTYTPITATWHIAGKNDDPMNILANQTYGTSRANAYKIIEDSLNLRDVQIYDVKIDEDGKDKRVLNRGETILAQEKQQVIKEAFQDFIFRNPERRERLVRKYNEEFNSVRLRKYDGGHLTFPGMNPDIKLRPHQVNAIARGVYGGNTLLAHVVGSGKTFTMIATAMEMKRIGLTKKPIFVVPNHLIEQWGAEFLRLYPSANVLLATKKDFAASKRKRFCSRIATGDYDAVIIGHSSFEKIPLSKERQMRMMKKQVKEIVGSIKEMEKNHPGHYSIKQLERTKKGIETKLDKLAKEEKKDQVVTIEELGIDSMFVDEAHSYKNLYMYTKMRNVAGLSQSEAQKSTDMFWKTTYINELSPSRGVIFATGTPVSNSMVELYTMQRYLQYDELLKKGLSNFDAWASMFGETISSIELAPEGTGYRTRSRFSRFHNLPELMSLFHTFADVQTADMLDLPTPKVVNKTIVIKPTEIQRDIVKELSERAEKVRSGRVKPHEDNMLKITNDGRKLALDQRVFNESFPDDSSSKVNACVNMLFQTWSETFNERKTQLVFCDMSTPKDEFYFSVYKDIKDKLVRRGIPEQEIAFVQQMKTDAQKAELFAKVRSGEVRILIGSTPTMGAGTNVQTKLVELYHLDCGWKPSDLEQRDGRIVRQGNENEEVSIYKFVTENTFDSYMWQILEQKQKFISQIMTSRVAERSCEDIDETVLSFAEIKALATGNPLIKEKMDLDVEVNRLSILKNQYKDLQYRNEDNILVRYPKQIAEIKKSIEAVKADIVLREEHKQKDFSIKIADVYYDDRVKAGAAILALKSNVKTNEELLEVGSFRGFTLSLKYSRFYNKHQMVLHNMAKYDIDVSDSEHGNMMKLENTIEGIDDVLCAAERKLMEVEQQLAQSKVELEKPFQYEAELAEKKARQVELNHILDLGSSNQNVVQESIESVHEEVEIIQESEEELEF